MSEEQENQVENVEEIPHVEEEDESEDIPEQQSENSAEDSTENPFGFLFCSSVTKCFAQTVTDNNIVFFSGNEYQGEMKEGIIHGNGTYKWTELGAQYTGTFKWGALTGIGTIQWKDGSVYTGSVVNGVREGKGKYRCNGPKIFVYEGEWHDGLFHGEGICYYGEEGCEHYYEGHFENGLRCGKGTMHYPTGNVYEGEWHNDKRHGKGKFLWKESGSYYIGDFVEGRMEGNGEIVYAFSAQAPSVQFVQSNRYLGEFKDSLRNGKGTFYYANGAVYKGQWENNLKNGQGTFTSRDGRVYESEFREGSIYQNGQLFVPTPSISLSFSLDGLLAPSESADEVMNSLCNIYVRFLPKLRALYQQYSRIQWADDKTITALRMIGMWRFIQDKGTILDPEFRLTDADDVIKWNLEKPSIVKEEEPTTLGQEEASPLLRSTYGFTMSTEDISQSNFRNNPLQDAPDPFATLFLYQLFESLVRLAHHRLGSQFPDSLILQVTRFLENLIFVDDTQPENEWSTFRRSISEQKFDDMITEVSPKLLDLYLSFCGYSSGTSTFQTKQLDAAVRLDSNVDVDITSYNGLMTVRDIILFMGKRGLFESGDLTVMQILLFIKYSGVSRAVSEDEANEFRKYFTSFMHCKVTFVEFVQTLVWAASNLIKQDWTNEAKFEYLVEHIDQWVPPTSEPEPAEADDEDGPDNEDVVEHKD